MQRWVAALFVLSVGVAVAGPVKVRTKVKPGANFEQEFTLTDAAAFRTLSNQGNVTVVPSQGTALVVRVTNDTNQPVEVIVDEVSGKQWRVEANVENTGRAVRPGGNVISGGNIRIGDTVIGGMVIGNGVTIINGVVQGGGGSGVAFRTIGRLDLRVEIPEKMLAHLDAQTRQGDVQVSDFMIEHTGPRSIRLLTWRGDVDATNVLATHRLELSGTCREILAEAGETLDVFDF